jgi:hypothetical protein
VAWWHRDFTVTVGAAWQVAPDAMVVRVRDDGASGTGPREAPYDEPGDYGLLVLPNGIFSELSPESLGELRAYLATPMPPPEDTAAWRAFAQKRLELLRLPLQVWTKLDLGNVNGLEREDRVTVPAGSFPHCFESRSVVSAHSSWAEWTCRGVGLVRRDMPRCSTFYGGHDADELLDYSVPEIRVVRTPDA